MKRNMTIWRGCWQVRGQVHRRGPGRFAALALLAASAALLSACTGLGQGQPELSTAASPASPRAASPQDEALAAFQTRQRAAAEAAEQQGRWAEAAWAWESVHAVLPSDESVAARLQQARLAAESRATLSAQQARLALQLGDKPGARELFLRALAAQPAHGDAIEGLRALEDERLRAEWVAPDPLRSAPPRQAQARAAAEFASLLLVQGEYQRAVDWLTPLVNTRRADPALRRQLSDVLMQLAVQQQADDPTAALATLRRSLQTDSRNVQARKLLREWQRPPAKRAAQPGSATPP